jgi:hypothetical protein
MAAETVCPRCGYKNSFIKGFLPGTCVCRVCQSQLDWREIPGATKDCLPAEDAGAGEPGCSACSDEKGPEHG